MRFLDSSIYAQNAFAAGAPQRTPLGDLTALPSGSLAGAGGDGARCPSQEPPPPPRLSALRASSFGPSGGVFPLFLFYETTTDGKLHGTSPVAVLFLQYRLLEQCAPVRTLPKLKRYTIQIC